MVSGGETAEGMRDEEDAAAGIQEDYGEEFDDDVPTGDEAAEAIYDEDEGDSFALQAGDESNGVYSDNEFDDDVEDEF